MSIGMVLIKIYIVQLWQFSTVAVVTNILESTI